MSAPSTAPSRRPFRISYRISLIIAFPLLVLVGSGAIVFHSYTTASQNVEALARTLFRDVSAQAGSESRRSIQRAIQTMQELQELAAANLLSDEPAALARQLLPMLQSIPEYAWISYSREDGAFLGVNRSLDGSFKVNHSWIDGGHTILDEFTVESDGAWRLTRHSDDHGYDPRARDFYIRATKAGRGVWTAPYVFFDGAPGITYAAPRRDPAGRRLGVFTVDYNLNGLAAIMQQVKLAQNGEMFMATADGTLLAHPRLKIVADAEQRGKGHLNRIADVADPVLTAYAAASRAAGMTGALIPGQSVPLTFDVKGELWMGAFTLIHIDDGLEPVVGVASPRAEFLGQTEASLRYSVLVSLLAVALAVAVAIAFASKVANPLTRMAHEMDRVGQFDLEAGAPRTSIFKEIDTMEHSLRRMKVSLRAFAAYVPRDLVRNLLAHGQEARLEGEIRTLTIFFSDVANFTTLSETLTPDGLVQRLGRYFQELGSVIGEHNGTLDKFLGDGIMAFWGAPVPLRTPALDAVRAALKIQEQLKSLRADPKTAEHALETRIGLATGAVLVGNIGTTERLNYTVMGDFANLASRLEALNKIYGTHILIDEATYRALGDAVICRPVDIVTVKGKSRGTTIYTPLCLATDTQAQSAKEVASSAVEALSAYVKGDMERAIVLYKEMLALNRDDRAAQVMAEKALHYFQAGVPANWSGTTHFLTK